MNKKYFLPHCALLLALLTALPDAVVAHGTHDDGVPADTAAIGGAFQLTDQNGKTVRDTDFKGRVMLVFFGFTHCPDICPITVATLSQLMELLGKDADKVAPVFITVDPARDTPQALKAYFANFDPRLVGLTGSDEQIQKATGAYKAYADTAAARKKAKASGGDYGVGHSTILYMMDKDGKYLRHFSYNAPVQELLDAVHAYLRKNP